MKKLIFIGGAMGVGKTTTARALVERKKGCVWLDGDWCWEQGCDWHFDEASRAMALDNICYLLKSFMKNPAFETVILSWVLHRQDIKDEILSSLAAFDFELCDIALVCDGAELYRRLCERYSAAAAKRGDVLDAENLKATYERTLDRLRCYDGLDCVKIDVGGLSPGEVCERVIEAAGL